MNETTQNEKTEVYSMRWFILAGFCLVTLLANFASKSFTMANQIYAVYYGVSLASLDWSTLALYLGATIATPVFAWLFFKQSVGFRILSITGASCLLISYLVIVLSIQFPILYPLMVVSNFLQGIAYTVSFSVGPSFAVLWFPDHQVGLAIAIDLLGQNVGVMLGAILPPLILKRPSFLNSSELEGQHHQLHIATSSTPYRNILNSISQHPQLHIWQNETHKTLVMMYSAAAGILVLLLIFFIIFVTDLPKKPPTLAMWVKRNTNSNSITNKSFAEFFISVKSLFQDVNFILCSLTIGIGLNFIIVFHLHIPAIVASFDVKQLGVYLPNDVIGGTLIAIFSFSNIIFGFVVAKITHKWQNYATQVVLGAGFTFVVFVGFVLTFYYDKFLGFCICVFFYSIGTRIFIIPLLEIITRHTYPIDETFVSVWVGAIGCIILVVIGEISRVVSAYTTPIGLLIMMCICIFIAFLLALFSNPTDQRREVDSQNDDECQNLLENN